MLFKHSLRYVVVPSVSLVWLKHVHPWVGFLGIITLFFGLLLVSVSPWDAEQGEHVRILYIHVPCAWWSLTAYVSMATLALVFLIWRIRMADVWAEAIAPVGASLTLAALVTGALWGKPTWGTYWVWDARLTSELVLWLLFMAYQAVKRQWPKGHKTGSVVASVVAVMGLINIPIIHYSVTWWATLHQGATTMFGSKPMLDPSMLPPLLWLLASVALLSLWAVLLRLRLLLHQGKNL